MGEEEKKTEETKLEEAEKPAGEEKKEEKKPAEEKKEESKDGNEGKQESDAAPTLPKEIILKVYMHCEGCARKVRRCLKSFEGVEDIITDCKSNKVVVKGEKADPLKVLARVQRKSHRQVELLSPIPKPPAEEEKKPEEKEPPKPEPKKEEPQIVTVVLRVHMHCEACAQEIKKRILRMRGVESAEADLKSSEVTVKGEFDPPKLVEYVHKRGRKHAVIVKQEPDHKKDNEENKEEAKEEKKTEENDQQGDKDKKGADAKCEATTEENKEKKEAKKETEANPSEETKVVELIKKNEYYPPRYYMENEYYPPRHYYMENEYYPPRYDMENENYPPQIFNENYPPQIFSDENPNACSVM